MMWDQWLQSVAQAGGESSNEGALADNPLPHNEGTTSGTSFFSRAAAIFNSFEWWRWLLVTGGAICMVTGVILLIQSGQSTEIVSRSPGEGAVQLLSAAASPSSDRTATVSGSISIKEYIYVDVAGAVTSPGVHKIEKSARAGAAVVAAGGLTTHANQLFIRKYFNAAAPLSDGQKMYIPFEKEEITDLNASIPTSREELSVISINTATAKELDALPGIGAVRAEEIVAGRPYSRLEELQERDIVTTSVYEGLVGLIRL